MSKRITLLAGMAILQIGFCPSPSMSENSSADDIPPNTESISETADAEKPAKFIQKVDEPEVAPKKALSDIDGDKTVLSSKKSKKVKEEVEDDKDSEDKDIEKQDKESAANAFMSQDDSHQGSNIDPLAFYQAGLRFMREKKYQAALDSFNKALELNPKYHEASFRKAQVYQLTGYDKYAARRYQDVLNYRPDMTEARLNLAALHRKHKHYSGAEEQLREVIAHNFYSFEGHYNLANVLVEDNKPEEALKEYKLCLKLKPNNPMVHNNLGVLFLQRNYSEEALQEFRKAAQLSPKNPIFTTNIQTTQKLIAEKKSKGLTM